MSVRDRADDDVGILDVRIRFTPRLPVVRLSGDLDLASEHLLADSLESVAANAREAEVVVLDMAAVRFCDVAGLRAIEWCAASLSATGKQLVLYHPPRSVTKLIEMTGVAQWVTIR